MANMDEIRRKQEARRLARLQKRKRTITGIILLLIIIIISFISVNLVMKKKSNDSTPKIKMLSVYPQPPKKTPDILASLPNNDGVKTAYLTFDDGPTTTVTPSLLDILRKYDVKATFFMIGALIDENPGIAYRVFNEGHTLAVHSYRHNYSYLYADEKNFMSETNNTYSLICDIVGRKDYPKIFRFPGGSYNAGTYGAVKQEYKKILEQGGYRYCDWNALSGDAESKSPVAATLLERVKSSTKNKEDVVILMHDAATKKVNITALPQIIEYLVSQGYTFSTLDKAP